jgi:hypothetical protein
LVIDNLLFAKSHELISDIYYNIDLPSNLPQPFPNSQLVILLLIILLSITIFILENHPKPKPYYASLLSSHYRLDTDDEEDLAKSTIPEDDDISSPEMHANIFSRLSFHWMDKLMKLGYAKDLEMDDLWALRPCDMAKTNSNLFGFYWEEETHKKKYVLFHYCIFKLHTFI